MATYRLSKERIAEVAVACERAEAEMVLSNGDVSLTAKDVGTVLVAGLARGERRIPEELLAQLRKEGATNSLLLLCDELLARPSVSLYQGRVALVGADATIDSIASRLRVSFAERETTCGTNRAGERAYPRWWSRDTSAVESLQFTEAHGGFTQLFALEGTIGLPSDTVLELRVALCDGDNRSGELVEKLEHACESSVGAICYNPEHDTLSILWPPSPHTLWMISPVRLPAVSSLSCSGSGTRTMQPSCGDMLLALSNEGTAAVAPAILQKLSASATLGGPAVFDAVCDILSVDCNIRATVTELR